MTVNDRQCDFALAEAKLVLFAASLGIRTKVKEWWRDIETQKIYVLKKVSKTLDSRHIDGLAVDLYIVITGNSILIGPDSLAEHKEMYRKLGVYWESLGGRWGGRFVDHAEFLKTNGREFDPSKDMGWDPYHFEFTKA